jgi:hypothetical protein
MLHGICRSGVLRGESSCELLPGELILFFHRPPPPQSKPVKHLMAQRGRDPSRSRGYLDAQLLRIHHLELTLAGIGTGPLVASQNLKVGFLRAQNLRHHSSTWNRISSWSLNDLRSGSGAEAKLCVGVPPRSIWHQRGGQRLLPGLHPPHSAPDCGETYLLDLGLLP